MHRVMLRSQGGEVLSVRHTRHLRGGGETGWTAHSDLFCRAFADALLTCLARECILPHCLLRVHRSKPAEVTP